MAESAGNNLLLKWIMGIVSTLLVAAVIGLWTKVDVLQGNLATLQSQVATSAAERQTLRRDMDELKASTKEILVIVTDIRIQLAAEFPNP